MYIFPYSSADEHIIYKTGKGIDEWFRILDSMKASKMKPVNVIKYLQYKFNIPAYRAAALIEFYLRRKKHTGLVIREDIQRCGECQKSLIAQ